MDVAGNLIGWASGKKRSNKYDPWIPERENNPNFGTVALKSLYQSYRVTVR